MRGEIDNDVLNRFLENAAATPIVIFDRHMPFTLVIENIRKLDQNDLVLTSERS